MSAEAASVQGEVPPNRGQPLVLADRTQGEPAHCPLPALDIRVQQVEGQRAPFEHCISGNFEQLLGWVAQGSLPEAKFARWYMRISRRAGGTRLGHEDAAARPDG